MFSDSHGKVVYRRLNHWPLVLLLLTQSSPVFLIFYLGNLASIHFCDVTWASGRLESPTTPLFVQRFAGPTTQTPSKFCNIGHLWGESPYHSCKVPVIRKFFYVIAYLVVFSTRLPNPVTSFLTLPTSPSIELLFGCHWKFITISYFRVCVGNHVWQQSIDRYQEQTPRNNTMFWLKYFLFRLGRTSITTRCYAKWFLITVNLVMVLTCTTNQRTFPRIGLSKEHLQHSHR